MKEMFYSEVLDKYFESKKECQKAELQYRLQEAEKEAKAKKAEEERAKMLKIAEDAKREAAAVASKEKKELSNAVEAADAKLTEAYHNYEVKQEEVKKLKEEYEAKIVELINPAKKAIRDAQQERYEAIAKYNKKYGIYEVRYSGDKAYNELKRATAMLDNLFDSLWF